MLSGTESLLLTGREFDRFCRPLSPGKLVVRGDRVSPGKCVDPKSESGNRSEPCSRRFPGESDVEGGEGIHAMTGPITVAMLNRKGGCGKTSTCHHLAGAFAKDGRPRPARRHGPASVANPGALRPPGHRSPAGPLDESVAGLFDDALDPDPDDPHPGHRRSSKISDRPGLERPRRLQRPPTARDRRDPAHPPVGS